VRHRNPAQALKALQASPEAVSLNGQYLLLLLFLATHQPKKACAWFERDGTVNLPNDTWAFQILGTAIVESRVAPLFRRLMSRAAKPVKREPRSYLARWISILEARWALEGGDLDGAARVLQPLAKFRPDEIPQEGLILQVLLSSLRRLRSPDRRTLADSAELRLAGTELDLARMVLGKKEQRPGELWPHPGWRPEWRLWLALWHEARGDRQKAREIAGPALDARYGLTHSQPALTALLARTEG
jgi:hypothetical protein